MAPSATPTAGPHFDVVKVHERRVTCDGESGPLGHPRIYLEMGMAHSITCPYCSRLFVLTNPIHRENEVLDPGSDGQ
jgi:uncharacterized Zn-finger protein